MPTYEKVDSDGNLVERSMTFAGKAHDMQLSTLAANVDSPWFAVNDNGERVKLNPMPTFLEPVEPEPDEDKPALERVENPYADNGLTTGDTTVYPPAPVAATPAADEHDTEE